MFNMSLLRVKQLIGHETLRSLVSGSKRRLRHNIEHVRTREPRTCKGGAQGDTSELSSLGDQCGLRGQPKRNQESPRNRTTGHASDLPKENMVQRAAHLGQV